MGKSNKNQHMREKIQADVRQSKQATFESLPNTPQTAPDKIAEPEQKKQIVITEIRSVIKEDELKLKVDFRLLPSKNAFSKIRSDLFFDAQKMSSTNISILPSPLTANDFELTPVFDMKGIAAGCHTIKVEMYELWSTGERLCEATKEIAVDYVPITRAERLVKVPLVKSVAGADLAVASEEEKEIFREISETKKKEAISKRDEW